MNNIPECMIVKAFYDCLASVDYKCYQAEFKDKHLPNGLLPDEFKDDVYEILNSRMNKSMEISKQKNIQINKLFDKEIKAYRKEWRNKTMMQPYVKAKNILAQDMFNHGVYEYDKFKVEFLKSLNSEYEKQLASHCNNDDLQSKSFSSVPCNLSYSLKEDNVNDYYLAVAINVIDSNYF